MILLLMIHNILKTWCRNGPTFCTSVANTYLTLREEELLSSASFCPIIWDGYIDDIFAIWRGEVNDLKYFLNTYNTHIKIYYE